jgi:AraC-like DNA-binding protein
MNMTFVFDARPSDSPFVEMIWRTQSYGGGSFTSLAESRWEMVVTKQKDKIYLTVRGPESKAMPSPIPEDREFLGIVFKLGIFMPHLPGIKIVDSELNLPEASSKSFWFHGASWQFPTFENADTFIHRLAHDSLLAREPVVEAVLQGELRELSLRSAQRRFLRATGLTHGAVRQIERARKSMALLEQGVSILDTVYEAGYADQPHMTRSLKHLLGRTPAQIIRVNQPE